MGPAAIGCASPGRCGADRAVVPPVGRPAALPTEPTGRPGRRTARVKSRPPCSLMPSTQRRGQLGAARRRRRLAPAARRELRGKDRGRCEPGDRRPAAGISRSQLGRLERASTAAPDLEHRVSGRSGSRSPGFVPALPRRVTGPRRGPARSAEPVRTAASAHPLRFAARCRCPIEGDRRAWDAMVDGGASPVFAEAETHIHDVQALERGVELKLRDDPRARVVVLVVARSDHHRAGARRAPGVAPRPCFRSTEPRCSARLRAGRIPAAGGIVLALTERGRRRAPTTGALGGGCPLLGSPR